MRDIFFAGYETINATDTSTAILLHYSPKNSLLVLYHRKVLLLVYLSINQTINIVLISSELERDLLVIWLRPKTTKRTILPLYSMW